MVENIVKKVKPYDMGYSLNLIQNAAAQVLCKKRWQEYAKASNSDAEKCEGMDGILLNGEYFDWRSFGPQKDNIVRAFLRYFTDKEIENIALML